jgi:hypothetical protein
MSLIIVSLTDICDEIGADGTAEFLSAYSCPKNPDIEDFLRLRAVDFSRQGIAATYLVLDDDAGTEDSVVIAGYFSLAYKVILVDLRAASNSRWRKRFARFGRFQKETERYLLAVPLIGQLGKNFSANATGLVSGTDLLGFAEDKIRLTQRIVGGKMVYIECADEQKLVSFYQSNGYFPIDRRRTEDGYLLQMIKYLQ